VGEDRVEKLVDYLARSKGCSRGGPVETLIGVVKFHLGRLELRIREVSRIKNIQSETKRKWEKLRKLDNEKKEQDEVIFSLR